MQKCKMSYVQKYTIVYFRVNANVKSKVANVARVSQKFETLKNVQSE